MDTNIDLLIEIPAQSSVLQVSPPSLLDLVNKLAGSTGKAANSISILFNRKGSWFKVSDNETYVTMIQRAVKANQDELELKVEFLQVDEDWDLVSSLNQTVSEEVKHEEIRLPEETHVEQTTNKLFYRYLNGPNSQNYQSLEINDLNILMIELSNLIVKQENLIESEWNCAFYSDNGSPITGSLSQMNFIKASELLKIGERVHIFIVPNFDIKTKEKIAPSGEDVLTITSKADPNVSYSLKIDLKTATVQTLKQSLYYFTDIPTYELTLKTTDSFLSRDDALLSEYQITSTSPITFEKTEVHYSSHPYKKHSKQSVAQSADGIKTLHSFLHTFSKLGEISEKPIRESFLGYIRQFTFNNAPYLSALYLLTKQKSLSLLSSIALEEGSILLARTVLTQVFQEKVEDSKLLEHVIEVFGLLCDLSCNPQEELSRGEVFKEYNIECPLTLLPIHEPVLIRRTDAQSMYYEHSEVVKKIKADEEIKYVGKPREADLVIDENFKLTIKRGELNNFSEVYIWEGVFDTTKSIGQLVSEKHSSGVNLAKALELKRAYKITKPVPPLSLKNKDFKDCMTYDKNNNIVIFFDLSNKEPNKVELMNVITRNLTVIDIDDLASAIEMKNPTQVGQEVITRNPDEAIVVVFDISGSMGTRFFDEPDFTRLDATKEFFETFTDRNAGFDFNHVISLILFSSSMTRACGFTENIVTFASHVQNAKHGGGTRLWDAIDQAVGYLNAFKASYPNVHLRILCLSDGEDTSSAKNYTQIAKDLVASNIIMDSIVVGALSQQLKAASLASGGFVFMPRTIPEGTKLFESETFLSVRSRQVPTRVLINSESDLIPLLNRDTTDSKPTIATVPTQATSKGVSISSALSKYNSSASATTTSATTTSAKSSPGGASLKRIMKELQDLENDPHPNCSIFPTEDDITYWNVYMVGPDTTPYENGTFHLLVEIPPAYPFKPPRVKFITPVYHCNINKNGSICHAILKDQWSPALTLKKVLDCIFGLLLTPEPSDPLDAYIATEYRMDYEQFVRNAKEFTALYAGKSVQEILNEKKNQMPPQFLCGITGNIMTDPVIVTKSNNTYERSEIMQVIQTTGKEPKTGEDITEADLVANVGLKAAIEEFHRLKQAAP